jgi:hypothetical protein
MAGGYTAEDVARFLKASKEKKLSTKDRKFINSFKMSPEEYLADEVNAISPASVAELETAISSAKDPKIRDVLLGERKNVAVLTKKHAPSLVEDEIDTNAVMGFINDLLSK